MSEFKFVQKIGKEIETILDEFAQLRITVFAEFPYLYEGNLSYEKEYIRTIVSLIGLFSLGSIIK